MFRDDRRVLPGISLPAAPPGFSLGSAWAVPVPPPRLYPPHPRPFDPAAFAGDATSAEDEPGPVILQAEPDPGLGFDAAGALAIVPVARFIELDCDHCLRGLEALGVRVDRCKGASAIDMTRNILATYALENGFEQILFIDSDMKFDPRDALRLFRRPEPVVGAVYAAKRLGKGQINVDYTDGVGAIRYGEWAREGPLYPVKAIGAGFLRIKVEVLRRLIDELGLPKCQMGGQRGYPFFAPFWRQCRDEECPRYLCEDYAFCWRCRDAGIQPYADTSIRTYHLGDYPYGWEEARGDYIPRERDLEAPARTIVPRNS